MYAEFAPGGMFPRPEDRARLGRYEQARVLYEGKHQDSVNAQRITQKLRQSYQHGHRLLTGDYGTAEGTVWVTFNLPRLIVVKFADLQVLNTPKVLIEDEAAEELFTDAIQRDVPDLWARMHYAKQLQRAFGDVPLTVTRSADGRLDVRVVDPAKWFPVLDPADHQAVLAHQLAWIEDHEEGRRAQSYLRVDVCYPDRVERRAYKVRGAGTDPEKTGWEVESQVDLGTHWPGLSELDEEDLGGAMSCVVLHNAPMHPGEIFGRPEFFDSGGLIDNISWRLSTWSDANDRVSHAPELIPEEWLSQDESGTVITPSQYSRRFLRAKRSEASEPRYMEYPLNFETLKQEYETTVLALLIRHEMSPALLGLQFGRERESGEAKSLGMGTTEAATRRDLLSSQPKIDRLLTVGARLIGIRDVDVSTHWRVGLPKTQAELMMELQQQRQMGLLTRKDMLEALYPWLGPDAIDSKLQELDAEREAEMSALMPEFTARQG